MELKCYPSLAPGNAIYPLVCVDCVLKLAPVDHTAVESMKIGWPMYSARFDGILRDDFETKPEKKIEIIIKLPEKIESNHLT